MRIAPVLMAALLLTACGSAEQTAAPAPAPSPTADRPTSDPPTSDPPTSDPSTSPAAPSGTSTARAVYWLGNADDARGPRLYREFAARPASADAVQDAVELLLAGDPADPDYTSLWAAGTTVRAVSSEGTVAVVDLSREATVNGGGSQFEALTLQQLVHTVTAADPGVTAVRLLVEGEPVETLWGAVDTRGPISRAPSVETLGPVWLDVAENATIDGTFGGTATVFEATVSWELRQGGQVVDDGFSTASIGAPGRGEWTATTDAAAGAYELRAYESSAKDGSVTWLDTKNVTIRR